MMKPLLQNSRRPDITFYPTGRIDITARIAKMLQLQPGDVINIASDGEEFILYVMLRKKDSLSGSRHAGTVYPTNNNRRIQGNNFRTYHYELYSEFRRLADLPVDSPARLFAGQPIIYGRNGVGIPLITRFNKQSS